MWNSVASQPDRNQIKHVRRDIQARWSDEERRKRRDIARNRQQQLIRMLSSSLWNAAAPAA